MSDRPRMPTRQVVKAPAGPLVINEWTFLAWPAFDTRWNALLRKVTAQKALRPEATITSPEATVLAALLRVIQERIARDPNDPDFRLRRELGAWRRVKFLGRLRLFYRFNSVHRVIILTWLNDENTLRKEGASTDPYVVFAQKLTRGEVPSDWEALMVSAMEFRAPGGGTTP